MHAVMIPSPFHKKAAEFQKFFPEGKCYSGDVGKSISLITGW
jgi:hypothetical protein